KLNKEINAALADPKIKARFADLGSMVLPRSPADFGKRIADDTEKWGKVIRAANIKAQRGRSVPRLCCAASSFLEACRSWVNSGSAEHVGDGVGARPVYPRNRTRRTVGR